MKETKSGLLKIMLPFAPYKCSACLVILESPTKLVEHMGVRHKGGLHRVLREMSEDYAEAKEYCHLLWQMLERPNGAIC